MRVALVTNIPAPYRVPVYDAVAAKLGGDFWVLYCKKTEFNRNWSLPVLGHSHVFLAPSSLKAGDREIHLNPGVLRALERVSPDVVVTCGFMPTMLLGWLRALGLRHVPMMDCWLGSIAHLGGLHHQIRRIVYSRSQAFIGASDQSLRLYEHFGLPREALFKSALCIHNEAFSRWPARPRDYDLLFSGRIAAGKDPMFFARVVRRLVELRKRVRVLVLGDGPLGPAFLDALQRSGAQVDCPGFVQPPELPGWYARARLLLFPTVSDCWGIVLNEALASGVPAITTDRTAAAHELIVHGETGCVLPRDEARWAQTAHELLEDEPKRRRMAEAGRRLVCRYNFQDAAEGIVAACRYALAARRAGQAA